MPPVSEACITTTPHAFAAGLVRITCTCGWREPAVSRLDAPGVRAAHAATCTDCQKETP